MLAGLRRLLGRPGPGILDLLEDLAHAGAQEAASLGLRLMVTAPHPLRFAWIDRILLVHPADRRVGATKRQDADFGRAGCETPEAT